MYQDEYIEEDIDIDRFVDDLIEVFKDMKPRYLPVAEGIACPICYSIIHDEVGYPEEGVEKMKCCKCSATFFLIFGGVNNVCWTLCSKSCIKEL